MSEIKEIQGGISVDYRGEIFHVNSLDMSEIERFYIIHQNDTSIIRAWHAHQYEKKWFYAIVPEVFHLSASDSKILLIPEGYANGIKADEPDSILMVFSNKVLSEALKDSWRYNSNLWMNWSVSSI